MISGHSRRRFWYTFGSAGTTTERQWQTFRQGCFLLPLPTPSWGCCGPRWYPQLFLHAAKQEEVRLHQVWRIGQVAEDLDAVAGEPILENGCSVTGALSQWKNDPCSTRTNLFFLKCFMKTSRTLMMDARWRRSPWRLCVSRWGPCCRPAASVWSCLPGP